MKNNDQKTILITGASGMVGSATVKGILQAGYRVVGIDRVDRYEQHDCYTHCVVDLSDKEALQKVMEEYGVDRVIHLAALAHAVEGQTFTWDDYHHLNVECAANLFEAAGTRPVLFISTVDVYGFARTVVDAETPPQPISHYAKSKAMAETLCQRLPCYSIFRLSPVYTDTVKRDIQKRYYLKYPRIAYRIGKGTEYEILNIRNAVQAMVEWCEEQPRNDVRVIKDPHRMNTAHYIRDEKAEGRARWVLYFPKWMIQIGYTVLTAIFGKNEHTYLLHKAVYPLRSVSNTPNGKKENE